MQIPVPENIAMAALGGDTTVLGEVQLAYAALKAAQAKANNAFQPEIAQVLADGLARSRATNGEEARMTIQENGTVVVVLVSPCEVKKASPTAVTAPVVPSRASKVGYPLIGALRARAVACGANINGISPQNKKGILEVIEAAEAAHQLPGTFTGLESVVEVLGDGETSDEETLAGSPEEEHVESPGNVENVPAVGTGEDAEVDLDLFD